MQQPKNIVSLDDSTANLLTALAELWGISTRDAVRLSLEETSANAIDLDAPSKKSKATIIRAALESILRHSDDKDVVKLTDRENFLLNRLFDGFSNAEIASELNLSEPVIRTDLNLLKAKVRSRLLNHRRRQTSKRLQALSDLQRRFDLSSVKAAAWQDAIHEARR